MIIDCHNHIGYDPYYMKNRPAIDLLKEMEENKVDKCVIFPFTNNPNIVEQNNIILEAINKFPDKLIGFFTMNPKLEKMTNLMSEYYDCGFKGVVTDPRYGVSHTSRLFHELVECAIVLDIPIWLHSDDKIVMSYNVSSISSLFKKYSEGKFILTSMYKDAIYVANLHHNVFLDTAVFELGQDLVKILQPIGSLRIFMGSNSPHNTLKNEKGKIIFSKELSEFQKSLIMGLNICKLLNL